MEPLSSRLREQILDLLWRLWTEVGVSGWSEGYPDGAIDPEPLVLFTVALGDADPRLRDEATDWCIRYGHFISGTRLRNLLTRETASTQRNFGEFAATVAAHSKQRWPGATRARRYRPTGRSRTPDFSRPSLIIPRLRALLGVGARAEIAKVFLSRPNEAFSAADLAGETNFTKRNVATALENLRMGGLLEALPVRNQLHYRQKSKDALSQFVGSLPRSFPKWPGIFQVLGTLLETASKTEKLAPLVREVEVKAVVGKRTSETRAAELPAPPLDASGPAFWPAFSAWTLAVVAALGHPAEKSVEKFTG